MPLAAPILTGRGSWPGAAHWSRARSGGLPSRPQMPSAPRERVSPCPAWLHSTASLESAQAVRRACYTLNTWLRSLRRPLGRLRGLRRCIFETMPGGIDLGLGGTLASGPLLGGGGCVLGDVVPDDCAGSAMDESGTLSGFHLRSQPQANRSNAYPA